ncbi:MAG TPA: SDR family oxidoreductase [Gemmatales bacterium]|nr:SDR family oxidoreductase [Gemmatales bacterium]
MSLLLTGGFGCIGSWIVKNLIEQNRIVHVYDTHYEPKRLLQLLEPEQLEAVHFHAGDVADAAAFRGVVEKEGITHIIHLAGLQVPVCRADPIRGARVNVLGTLSVFEAVKGQVQRIVFASSAAVFGPPEDETAPPLGDHADLTPTTHYGVYKAANEGNARIYYQENGICSVGIRPATVYGVGRDFGMTSEPTKALKCLVLRRPYYISFGGWQDMQYADDVAKVFLRCAEKPDFTGARVYNLKGHRVEISEIHSVMCQLEPEAKTSITYGNTPLPVAYDFLDSGLQKEFGPLPLTPLLEGFEATWKQFQKLHSLGRLDLSDLPTPA